MEPHTPRTPNPTFARLTSKSLGWNMSLSKLEEGVEGMTHRGSAKKKLSIFEIASWSTNMSLSASWDSPLIAIDGSNCI